MKIWPYLSELIQFLSLPVVLHSSAAPPPPPGGAHSFPLSCRLWLVYRLPCEVWKSAMAAGIEEKFLYTWKIFTMQQTLLAKFHENLTLPERVDSIFEPPRHLTFECCPSLQGGSFISCELQIKVVGYSLPWKKWKSAIAAGIEENSLYTWRYSPCSRYSLQSSMKIWPYLSELIQFLNLSPLSYIRVLPLPPGGLIHFLWVADQGWGLQFALWNMKICHGSRYWRKLSIHLKIFTMQQMLLAKFHENLALREWVDSIFESPRRLTFECCPSPIGGGGSFISYELQIMVGIQFPLWNMKICHGSRYWRKLSIHLKIFTTWRYSDAPCKVPWQSDLT